MYKLEGRKLISCPIKVHWLAEKEFHLESQMSSYKSRGEDAWNQKISIKHSGNWELWRCLLRSTIWNQLAPPKPIKTFLGAEWNAHLEGSVFTTETKFKLEKKKKKKNSVTLWEKGQLVESFILGSKVWVFSWLALRTQKSHLSLGSHLHIYKIKIIFIVLIL